MRNRVTKRFLQICLHLLLMAALLFGGAGRLDWALAWIFLGLSVFSIVLNGVELFRVNRELISERSQTGADTPRWDRILVALYAFWGLLALLVAGLDERMVWSTYPPAWLMGLATMGFMVGSLWASSAMWVNAYFATTVRIQAERQHEVVSHGPYRLVRHPAYAGWILVQLSIPLLLGSYLALIPGILAALTLVIRTGREDRFLKIHLPGYADYSQEVRFRLFKGLW